MATIGLGGNKREPGGPMVTGTRWALVWHGREAWSTLTRICRSALPTPPQLESTRRATLSATALGGKSKENTNTWDVAF